MHPWASASLPMTLFEGEGAKDGVDEGNDDAESDVGTGVAAPPTTDATDKALTARMVRFLEFIVIIWYFRFGIVDFVSCCLIVGYQKLRRASD
jgi:hypothetical protein